MRAPLAAFAALAVLAACDGDPEPAPMRVSIFKLVDEEIAGGCWLLLPGTDALSGEVDLAGTACARDALPADATLERDADRLQLVVEYSGLDFSERTTIAKPTGAVRVDGVLQTGGVAFGQVAGVGVGGFIGTLTVPAAAGAELSIVIEANVGYASPSFSFPLRSPAPALAVADCDGTCERTAAVGSVSVTVSIAASAMRQATLRQRLDSMLLPSTTLLPLSTQLGNRFEGSTTLDVPASASGVATQPRSWQISAVIDGAEVLGPVITLTRPTVDAALVCGETCTPAAGESTAVRITAPRGIRPAVATINVFVGGAPHLLGSVANLTSEDSEADEVSGFFSFTPPDRPGAQLVIESSVAGFRATTIATTIGPAPAPPP